MKERPILFSAPMVRAILDGRKTQTRRVVKPGAVLDSLNEVGSWDGPGDEDEWIRSRCPFGAPGDRLWVRETWQHEDGSCDDAKCGQPTHIYYRATESYPESLRWRPAIFMQRWASRITLEVTAVRVERLRAISDEDAFAEGLQTWVDSCGRNCGDGSARDTWAALWDSINGERAPWASNPWVWVVAFEREEARRG